MKRLKCRRLGSHWVCDSSTLGSQTSDKVSLWHQTPSTSYSKKFVLSLLRDQDSIFSSIFLSFLWNISNQTWQPCNMREDRGKESPRTTPIAEPIIKATTSVILTVDTIRSIITIWVTRVAQAAHSTTVTMCLSTASIAWDRYLPWGDTWKPLLFTLIYVIPTTTTNISNCFLDIITMQLIRMAPSGDPGQVINWKSTHLVRRALTASQLPIPCWLIHDSSS